MLKVIFLLLPLINGNRTHKYFFVSKSARNPLRNPFLSLGQTCTCPNGIPTTGAECETGGVDCSACNDGFGFEPEGPTAGIGCYVYLGFISFPPLGLQSCVAMGQGCQSGHTGRTISKQLFIYFLSSRDLSARV